MSRDTINEEIYTFSDKLVKGMESITILEPGRMRVPFGAACKATRKQSWMSLPEPSLEGLNGLNGIIGLNGANAFNGVGALTVNNVVYPSPRDANRAFHMEVPRELNSIKEPEEYHCEVQGWMLAVGYAFFGVDLALCNLLAVQQAGMVCAALSPVPVICLLLQTIAAMNLTAMNLTAMNLTAMNPTAINRRHAMGLLGSLGLALSAASLPAMCVYWVYWSHWVYCFTPFLLVLSASTFSCVRRRGAMHWICLSGVWLALLFTLPLPVQVLEPRWGLTIAIFFACCLCFLAGLGSGRLSFLIKVC